MHDLHLKLVSHSVAVSIQETASQLTDELPVCNSIQYSNSEKYGNDDELMLNVLRCHKTY